MRILYRGIPSSLANSSGIFLGAAAHCDMVRPGVALYGVNPTPGQNNPMQPVIELQARIVQVRTVPRGETVGYDAAWTAKRATRIAVVAVGYADGYLRAASASDKAPGADAIVAGERCPLAGRVSMDLLAIDITDLPDNAARRGDLATLIGGEIDGRRRSPPLPAPSATRCSPASGGGITGFIGADGEIPLNQHFLKQCSCIVLMAVLACREPITGAIPVSKRNLSFICQNCGAAAPRWQGKCEACGEWNTLAEEGAERAAGPGRKPAQGPPVRARAAHRRGA